MQRSKVATRAHNYWDCVGVRACALAHAHATRGARQMGRASMYGTWYALLHCMYMHACLCGLSAQCLPPSLEI